MADEMRYALNEEYSDSYAGIIVMMMSRALQAQLRNLILIIGDTLNNDQKYGHGVEAMALRGLLRVADSFCQQGINWGRIVVLFHVACRRSGRLAVRILEFNNSMFVKAILICTLNFLCTQLLHWSGTRDRGREGLINENQLAARILIVSEGLRNDQRFQEAINAVTQAIGSRREILNLVTQNVCRVFSVTGRATVGSNSFSELATTTVNRMTSSSSGLILTLITGVAFGSIITWVVTRRL